MRFIHRFIGAVLALVATAAGVFLGLQLATWHTSLAQFGEWVGQRDPMHIAEVAGGLLLLAFLYLITGMGRRKQRLLSFDNDAGTVSISTDAICDYISKLAPEFPTIVRLVPDVVV